MPIEMTTLASASSETFTIAIPVGLVVVASQSVVNALTAWLSNRNGKGKVQEEIRDGIRRVADSNARILRVVTQPGPDGLPLVYRVPSLDETNRSLDRIASRLERHMEIMERHHTGGDDHASTHG